MFLILAGRVANALGKIKRANKTLFSDKHLFVTNIVISASLSGVGDAIEQKWHFSQLNDGDDTKTHEFDYARSRNMCIAGVATGLLTHKWYRWLDTKYPGRTADVILNKVLLDTLVFSPMQILTFFLTMGFLEKSDFSEVRREIYSKGRILYLFEWMAWAPLQVLNFYFLPSQYRVLFDNTFSLVYDVFVSYVKFDRPEENLEVVVPEKRQNSLWRQRTNESVVKS